MTDKAEPKNSQAPKVTGGGITRMSEAVLKPARPQKVKKRIWNAEHWPDDPGSFAAAFPEFWTVKGELPGDDQALTAFFAFYLPPGMAGYDAPGGDNTFTEFMDGECGWYLLCRDLQRAGRPVWRYRAFRKVYSDYLESTREQDEKEFQIMRAKRELADNEAERAERAANRRTPGRRATLDSNDALKIEVACEVTRRWSWHILRNGTSNRETQDKLARIFAHDPARNYPGAWALKVGTMGRPAGAEAFKTYCLSRAAEFDADATSDALAQAYSDGRLPTNFRDLADFLTKLGKSKVDVNPFDAVATWAAYEAWRVQR